MRGECTCGWYLEGAILIRMKSNSLSHALSSSEHMVIFQPPSLPKYTDLSIFQSHNSKSKSSIQNPKLQIKIQTKQKPFSKSFEIEYFLKKSNPKRN